MKFEAPVYTSTVRTLKLNFIMENMSVEDLNTLFFISKYGYYHSQNVKHSRKSEVSKYVSIFFLF